MKILRISIICLSIIVLYPFCGFSGVSEDDGMDQLAERLKLGQHAPDFQLLDVVSGQPVSRDSARRNQGLLIMVISRSSSYFHRNGVKESLIAIGRDYQDQGLGIIAICPFNPENEEWNSPEGLRQMASRDQIPFPLLFDENQDVVRSLGAYFTPDIFLFDKELNLVYNGALDYPLGAGEKSSGKLLREVIQFVIEGKPVPESYKTINGSGGGTLIDWIKK